MRYAWPEQQPNRKTGFIGTVRRVTFADGSRARMTHPFTIQEAIVFFDPFHHSHTWSPANV